MYWRPCLPVPDLSAWSHAGLHVVRVTVMVLLYATALFIGKQLPPASVRLSTSAHQCPLLYDTATFTVNPSNCLTIKVWHTVHDTSGQTLGTPSIAPPQICLHSQAYACLHVRKSPGAGPSICHSYVFCQSHATATFIGNLRDGHNIKVPASLRLSQYLCVVSLVRTTSPLLPTPMKV